MLEILFANRVSNEYVLKIASFLDPLSSVRASRVCKNWRDLFQMEKVWQHYVAQRWNSISNRAEKYSNYKRLYQNYEKRMRIPNYTSTVKSLYFVHKGKEK